MTTAITCAIGDLSRLVVGSLVDKWFAKYILRLSGLTCCSPLTG